jgi:hypothetical protein
VQRAIGIEAPIRQKPRRRHSTSDETKPRNEICWCPFQAHRLIDPLGCMSDVPLSKVQVYMSPAGLVIRYVVQL